MKTSTIIKRALVHHGKYTEMLAPISEAVSELLEDDGAHIFLQTDGLCVVWGEDMNNSRANGNEVELLLSMSKEDAIEFLTSRLI